MHVCRPRAPAAAGRRDARALSAHGCGHGRALDRSRLSAGLRPRLRRQLARLRSVRRDASAGDARDSLAGGVQHVPHLPGLDRPHPSGPQRRHAAADPHRRRHLLRASARAAGRCGGDRSLRRRAGTRAWRQPGVAPGDDGGHGLDSGGAAGRHGVLAHGHLPRRGRQARGQRIRERHLHRLGAGLSEEPRVPAASSGRRFSRADPRRISPRWTSRSTSRAGRPKRI